MNSKLKSKMYDGSRRPSWILIFVNFGYSAMVHWWISSHVPYLKCLARTVQKLSSSPKSKMAAGGYLEFWFSSILVIPPCSHRGSLALCQISNIQLEPFKRYELGLNRNLRWRPAAIGNSDFVNFGYFAMFHSWICSPVPNLKCLVRTVQKLWALNRNPRWRQRPSWILIFVNFGNSTCSHRGSLDVCQIWRVQLVPFKSYEL